jgi:hypothetical protein
MSREVSRTRAQYLNGVGVAILGSGFSAVLAGAPIWLLPPVVGVSAALHFAALRSIERTQAGADQR